MSIARSIEQVRGACEALLESTAGFEPHELAYLRPAARKTVIDTLTTLRRELRDRASWMKEARREVRPIIAPPAPAEAAPAGPAGEGQPHADTIAPDGPDGQVPG